MRSYYLLSLFASAAVLLLGAASTPGQSAGAGQPLFTETFIWKYSEDGYVRNHVHSLVATRKGTLLAFSEGRYGYYDGDPSDLIMKRSTDLGSTWSDDTLIERSNGSFYDKEGVEGKREAWVNPVAVVDNRSGRVFVFYALNEGSHQQNWTRVFYRYSDDEGVTWQPKLRAEGRVEVTDLLKNNKNDWTLFMPGPGHGIQLEHQKGASASKNGRLMIQLWNRRAINKRPRNYGVVILYSDDGGKTWKRGAESDMRHGENESRIVEFSDGRILLNARGSDAADNGLRLDTRRSRIFAYSSDGGESFSATVPKPDLNYTNIDSGLARYTAPDGRECAVLSHPDDPERRIKMTARMSCDGLQTWPHSRLIDEGRVGYSDVVILPDNTIGVLYGTLQSVTGLSNMLTPSGVKFARFDHAWLVQQKR